MPYNRVPLPHNIASRDGTLNKDAKLGNCVIEVTKGENVSAIKRPGLSVISTVTAGQAQGVYSLGSDLFTIVNGTFYKNGTSVGSVSATGGIYTFITTVDSTQLYFKNTTNAYVYTVASNVILDLLGTITTQTGTLTSGSPVVTLSASNALIQVGQNITGTGIPTGTYVLNISGTALTLSSNATAGGSQTLTFTTSYPSLTVPGAVFLDGYYVVGTPDGLLHNSNVEDPTTWQAINYIGAVSDADQLVGIGRTINYICAFGQYTTEFFYDAGSSPGSPFLPYQNSVLQFGCATGYSIVQMDNTIIWMSASKQKGRQIVALSGQTPQFISNGYIDRILNLSTLATVYSYSVRTSGHSLYILTLVDLDITLVYDFAQQGWTYWSSTELNVESYFKAVSYTNYNGTDVLQHESNGTTMSFLPDVYQDYGNPITVLARTPLIDGGNNLRKFFSELQVIGDKVDSFAKIRWTSDDYQNWSSYYDVDLGSAKSQVHRMGQGRRRAFDVLHTDNVPLRLMALELMYEQGDT